jgi:hypothetical protein
MLQGVGRSTSGRRESASSGRPQPMSALGHEQTSRHVHVMSVIPLKADIRQSGLYVRLVPIVDIRGPSAGGRL